MSKKMSILNTFLFKLKLALLLLLATSASMAATTVPLSNVPLYGSLAPHPNVAVSLSVEFPTVGVAYNQIAYVRTSTYLGYFDSTQCYLYSGTYTNGYFYPSAAANVNHECNNAFSGNFMNWVAMSAIDEFRMAMTGGNRITDTATTTTLERAYLPDWFYNTSYFPTRTLDNTFSSAANMITPFSGTIYVSSCRNMIYLGTGNTSNSCGQAPNTNSNNDLGTYQVRVQVCDATEGPVRTALCQAYGTNYKPVGQVQKNINNMRFSALGYLMDNNRGRYGGVLRAPMNYVGQYQYDASLNQSANSDQEINANGTFTTNPLGDALGISGFVNYINKFGQSGTYKTHDPASELFYETLRYYQNLGPTPQAISGVTAAMADGFPYYTTWTDPILASCQPNYIINVSDANTWDDASLPGYTGIGYGGYDFTRPIEGGFDVLFWTQKIGTLESDPTRGNNLALANLQNQPTGVGNATYFIAGAAYFANTQDIRPDLTGTQTVKTFSFDVAEPSIAYARRQLYLAGKYGGFNDSNGDGDPFYAANPLFPGTNIRNNSEWEDAPGSGYPANYLLASDPNKLINGLAAAFSRINQATGTISGISLSSSQIIYGNSGAFTVAFNPNKWSGSVSYKSITYNPATQTTTVSGPIWDSAVQLDTALAASTPVLIATNTGGPRQIFTMRTDKTPIAFDWTSISADVTYAGFLDTNPQTSTADALGQARINYLRGDRTTNEGSFGAGFRSRASAIGDIINSAPVYKGAPSSSISGAGYSTFYSTYLNRTPAVYVGANDGMLHAINATNGNELFSYVPRAVASQLNQLTNPAYVHVPFVDAVPDVREANLGTVSSPNWRTVLVSGLGGGAQGVFALDVTNPSSFGTSNVLWEFSDADDADFGNVVGTPTVVRINTAAAGLTPVYQWFAIVTGYNSLQADGNAGTDQSGIIFLLALNKSTLSSWILGTNYYKIKTPFTSTYSNTANPNGLSPVVALANPNGGGDAVALYTGDLQGNLWKINLTGGSSTWTGNTPVMFGNTPLFSARDSGGNPQPITERPDLVSAPYGGVMVLFGTGKYLESADLSSTAQQSFYGIYDNRGTTTATTITLAAGRSALAQRTLVAGSGTTAGQLTVTGAPVTYTGATAKKGWYFDFLTSGERSISTPALDSGLAYFSTLTVASTACGAGGGSIYGVNAVTGLAAQLNTVIGNVSNVGIPGPVQIVTTAYSNGAKHASGEIITQTTKSALSSGTAGLSISNGTVIKLPKGRIAWRQLSTN